MRLSDFWEAFVLIQKKRTKNVKLKFLNKSVDILIHQAYPCKSIVENQKERQKNVDLCPESAAIAR